MFLIVSFCRFLEDNDAELKFLSTSCASDQEESHWIQQIEDKDHEDFRDTGIDTSQSKKRKYTAEEVKKLSETDEIRSICLLIINVYVKVWFNAPKATLVPSQDLRLLKTLINYANIDGEILKVALSKIISH